MSTGAYPKILHVGDKQIADLFDKPVEITEKIDGSQFGFGLIDGKLICRSKGLEQDLDNPDKLFKPAIEHVKSIQDKLPEGIFFYAETLGKPRHSTLAYDRTPKNHIALFGALDATRTMLPYKVLQNYAKTFDVDIVPLIYEGVSQPEHMLELLETDSYLGGQKIEGVVVKRYEPWLFLGQILTPVKAGKFVSERFKEVHTRDWAKLNTSKGALDVLKLSVRTEARWDKAISHLREKSEFEGTARDIGKLIKEVHHDIADEEKENLKDQLWKIYGNDILKASTNGFVNWYKERIAKGDFNETDLS